MHPVKKNSGKQFTWISRQCTSPNGLKKQQQKTENPRVTSRKACPVLFIQSIVKDFEVNLTSVWQPDDERSELIINGSSDASLNATCSGVCCVWFVAGRARAPHRLTAAVFCPVMRLSARSTYTTWSEGMILILLNSQTQPALKTTTTILI